QAQEQRQELQGKWKLIETTLVRGHKSTKWGPGNAFWTVQGEKIVLSERLIVGPGAAQQEPKSQIATLQLGVVGEEEVEADPKTAINLTFFVDTDDAKWGKQTYRAVY